MIRFFKRLFGANSLSLDGHNIKAKLTAGILGFSLASAPGLVWSEIVLDGEEDFTNISKRGFGQTIDGVFNPGPILKPDLGSGRNSYTWSMGWYDADADGPGLPSLYVGTVRDILCPFGFDLPITEVCLEINPDAPFGFDANQRAEIWRYDPSSFQDYGGANGTWHRVYQSPLGGFNDDPLVVAIEFLIENDPDSIPGPLQDFTSLLSDLRQVPRDVGYRNQAVCKTRGDSRERLFATTSGVPGNVLYINDEGTSFERTSNIGLKSSLARFLPVDILPDGIDPSAFPLLQGLPFDGDIGYRGLVCFNGYLITSPASSVDSGSQDVSENAFLLGNADPAMQDGAISDGWEPLVDFRNFPDLDYDRDGDLTNLPSDCDGCGIGTATADPSNYGAFDIAVLGGDIWVAVSNRGSNGGPDRGGVELWRGDGTNFGYQPDGNIMGDGSGISWNKVIDVGAGRREDAIGSDVDNALGVFGTLNGELYMALWESGFGSGDGSLAEMIKIDPGTGPGDETWELLIGGGRQAYATDPVLNGTTATGEMVCAEANRYDESTNMQDNSGPDCYPSSGRHLGYGAVQAVGTDQFDSETPPAPVNAGTAVYFWRMGTHHAQAGDELYMGTLDQDSFNIPDVTFPDTFIYDNVPPNFGFLCGGDFALAEFWEFLQAADPTLDDLPPFVPPVYGLPDCEVNPSGGLDLVKTTDGDTWTDITTDGFDNPLNYGVRAILSAELPDGSGEQVLFIGTANPFTNAPEVPGTESYSGGAEVFMGADISQIPALSAVTGIDATDDLQEKVEISWDAVANAVSYNVFRSTTSNIDDAQFVSSVDGGLTSFEDTMPETETTVYYWVKVITDTGASGYGTPAEGFAFTCTFYTIGGNQAVVCI